jgi:hypothetical protein
MTTSGFGVDGGMTTSGFGVDGGMTTSGFGVDVIGLTVSMFFRIDFSDEVFKEEDMLFGDMLLVLFTMNKIY